MCHLSSGGGRRRGLQPWLVEQREHGRPPRGRTPHRPRRRPAHQDGGAQPADRGAEAADHEDGASGPRRQSWGETCYQIDCGTLEVLYFCEPWAAMVFLP